MLNLKPNFLKIYSATPYDFMLKILFTKNLLFWYIKILLQYFSLSMFDFLLSLRIKSLTYSDQKEEGREMAFGYSVSFCDFSSNLSA